MTHSLNKLLPPKSSSRHQYQQVPLEIPLNAESDSEDDYTLLYKAPSLNETNLQTFGVSMYDHSHDLDLPRISQLLEKDRRDKRRRNCINSKAVVCIFVVVACLLMALISAFAILVARNWDYFSVSSNPSGSTPAPSCFPKSPSDDLQYLCQTTHESTVPPVTTHPVSPPSPHSSLSEASSGSITLSETEDEISTHTSQVVSDTSTQPPHPDITSKAETTEEEGPTSVGRPTEGTDGYQISITSNNLSVGSHDTPSEEPEVTFDVEEITTVLESTCVSIPKPLPNDHTQLGHTPSPSSFPPHSHFMNLVKSAIPFPTPAPTSPEVEPRTITTPANDGTTTTDALRKETMLPINFDQPTSATTTKKENSMQTKISSNSTQQIITPSFVPSLKRKPLFWERKFMASVSESTPVVYDLDGDGIGERLVVEDFISSWCAVRVYALSGINGSTVWQQEVLFPVFAVRCILDANGDGTVDCIVAGRVGGFLTLDGRDGHLLWAVDESLVFPMYNFYFPLLIPDFNGDSVDDLINIHGGDPSYEPEDHNRSPAFLVAVSGRTGQKLMAPIPMPDGHESYSSPVLFAVNNVDKLVLFGSGGETVPGSLWGIELMSLQFRIASYLEKTLVDTEYQINLNYTLHPCSLDQDPLVFQSSRPVMDRTKFDLNRTLSTVLGGRMECPTWGERTAIWNDYNVCLYEFVRSVSKGVMLPPVAVDLTEDGVKDLVVSTFDGHTIALDGLNLYHTLWDTYYQGTESYRLL